MSKTSYRRRAQLEDTSNEQPQRSFDAQDAWALAAIFFFCLAALPLLLVELKSPFWAGLSEGARAAWVLLNVFLFGVCFLTLMAHEQP